MSLHFLQEYYSDAAPTVIIVNFARMFVKNGENAAVITNVKKSDISTEQLVNELELKASNKAFVTF